MARGGDDEAASQRSPGPATPAVAKRLSLGEPSETRLSPFGVRGWAVLAGSAGAPILDAVDPVLERLHGYGPGELLGRPLIELFAARGRDAVEQAARAGNRGETF